MIFALADGVGVALFGVTMASSYIFSSESVGEGHPDKVADYISDSILDACLAQDPTSRVACETLVKSNQVFIAGEITTKAELNYERIVREAIREIGYTFPEDLFHADSVFITNALTKQSPDIAQGVDERNAEGKDTAEQGAGDQGLMFGYACDETPELMPAAVMYAHRLGRELSRIRHEKVVPWLRPDAKSQVSIRYEDGKAVEVTAVVISTQHAADVSHATIRDYLIENVIRRVIPASLLTSKTEFLINPTGRFVLGGPSGDAGLTGRKIIVDTYGGSGRHGGGAFSGKDPTKVDRSAAYMCRWVAKNIVAAKLAKRVELQVAYAIGHPRPVSIFVDTFGTGTVDDQELSAAVSRVFGFKPAEIIQQLDLRRPIYRGTTNYGHFGKADLPWEQTNKVAALKEALSAAAVTA
jgi:S-adenosylmethionine synthetase